MGQGLGTNGAPGGVGKAQNMAVSRDFCVVARTGSCGEVRGSAARLCARCVPDRRVSRSLAITAELRRASGTTVRIASRERCDWAGGGRR